MKLAFYDDYEFGIIQGGTIYSAASAIPDLAGHSPQAVLEAVIESWASRRARLEACIVEGTGRQIAQVRLRPPVPRPSKILCAVANYREGIADNVSELDFFHKSPSAIIGDGDTMVLPNVPVTIVHHELELGVVIGRRATDVSEKDALAHVFGYLIFQDGSARGIKVNGQNSFYYQKSWDTFAPIGPMLVTADEIPDPQQLQVRLWANGELRQDYNTSDMAHSVARQVSVASQINTLCPGDIIATGCNRQGLGPMQHGDVIVQEIEGLGRLTTRVEDPQRRSWPYGIDQAFAEFVRLPRDKRQGGLGAPRIVPAGAASQV